MVNKFFKTLNLKQRLDNIIADFAHFSSWEEKYEYLIEFGYDLQPLPNDLKTNTNLIHGCQSKVWLVCKYEEKKLYFYGDSDALITKGLVALIIKLYSGCSVTSFYDGLISKIISKGKDREECIMRLKRALDEYVIEGIETNIQVQHK